MKRIHLYGIGLGTAALLVAGSALADPPAGLTWNDWTATAGNIDLNTCTPPACVVLLDELGMLQARVRDTGGDGFFQTITVDEAFTGPALSSEFRNESFVAATDQTTNFDMAALTFVDLSGEGVQQVELASGSLRDADNNEASLDIWQTNTFAGFGNVEFWFAKQLLGGQFSTNTAGGDSLRIDYEVNNVAGDRGTPFTLRQTSGFYTQGGGTLTNVDASTITYSDGQHIGTMFLTGLLWHGGPMHMPGNDNRVFEIYNLQNFTTAEATHWVSTNNEIDDTGIGFVDFRGAWQDANVGDAIWDPAGPFGATPSSVASYPAAPNFAVIQGAAAFPGFPDHTP